MYHTNNSLRSKTDTMTYHYINISISKQQEWAYHIKPGIENILHCHSYKKASLIIILILITCMRSKRKKKNTHIKNSMIQNHDPIVTIPWTRQQSCKKKMSSNKISCNQLNYCGSKQHKNYYYLWIFSDKTQMRNKMHTKPMHTRNQWRMTLI